MFNYQQIKFHRKFCRAFSCEIICVNHNNVCHFMPFVCIVQCQKLKIVKRPAKVMSLNQWAVYDVLTPDRRQPLFVSL